MVEVFTQRTFVAEFNRLKLILIHSMVELSTSYIARWKARSQLLISNHWKFFASSYSLDVISRYWSKSAFFEGLVGG